MIAYNCDSLCDFMEDILNLFMKSLLPVMFGYGPFADPETHLTFYDKHTTVIEARLTAHGKPFVAGTDRPTIADFKMFAPISFGF